MQKAREAAKAQIDAKANQFTGSKKRKGAGKAGDDAASEEQQQQPEETEKERKARLVREQRAHAREWHKSGGARED